MPPPGTEIPAPGARPGGVRIDPATPLAALEIVVLDTETTGLDVARDRILQIGAVVLRGRAMVEGLRFSTNVAPGVPIPPASSRIHGLTDADLADAPGTRDALEALLGFIGERVLAGHNIFFDLAILRHEAARVGLIWPEIAALDAGLIGAALTPGRVDTSLDALALGLGVSAEGRHTAVGDAETTARVIAEMIEPLRLKGVRTLAELRAFQRRPSELIQRQEQAGWFASPSQRPDFSATAQAFRPMQKAIDSFLYRHRLRDVMGSPPIAVARGETLHAAAETMRRHGVGALMVEPLDAAAAGILTERDVLYAFARHGAAATAMPVGDLMSCPVIALPEETLLYRALGLMARKALRYLAVTDARGRVSGVFTLRSLLRERALATLSLGDQIAAAPDAVALACVQAELPSLAAALLADGLDARRIAEIISAEGRAMTARAGALAEAEMVAAGLGPAPAAYAVLVLGSGGRGESLLAPDQDNALIVADDYPRDPAAPEDWFALWGQRMARILDAAGVPFCKGGVMVSNPAWRRRLGDWVGAIERWAETPLPGALLNVDIFFDFACVAGERALAGTLRAEATRIAGASPLLTRMLAEQIGQGGSLRGLFGRLRTDAEGRADLKAGALLPIVSGARVLALARGIAETATPERLLRAAERAGSGEADARTLVDIHLMVLHLVLSQQIADIGAGVPPSSRIDPGRLDRDQRRTLMQALESLELVHEMVRGALA